MISEDDVFQEQQEQEAVVVDCDLLEAAKENVQPLATGRRVTSLSALLSTPHAQREAKLSATRNRLRVNVELALEDEDGDPLEAYSRLVNWTLENYPQGHSAESGLLELLEEATRVLKNYQGGIYCEDLKYLKLWLLYASYVEKPTIIYKFLLANDIGVNFALFYEEHAAVLERDGRKKEADEIYALGIARKAVPLDHLESRYQDFQKRMMSTGTASPAEPPVRQDARQALAATSSHRPSSSRTLGSRSVSTTTTTTTAASLPPASNAGFQIFMDPTGAEAQAADPSENMWQDLGTRKSRVKENIPETKKLSGTTIKQAGRAKRIASASSVPSGSSSSRIVPFRDPVDMPPPPVPASRKGSAVPKTPTKGFVPFVDGQEEAAPVAPIPSTPKFTPFRDEDDAGPSGTALPVGDSVIKVKKAGIKAPVVTTAAEALRKDPLKNYSDYPR